MANQFYVGLGLQSHSIDIENIAYSNQGWFLRYDGYLINRNKFGNSPSQIMIYDGYLRQGDTVSVKVDMDKKQVGFFLNGAQLGSGIEQWFSLYLNQEDMTRLRPVVQVKEWDDQVEIY